MRRTLHLTVAMLFGATLLQAASTPPRLQVLQPSFSFGTVTQGKKVEHVFTLRNLGSTPLVVEKITTSCGCTATTLSSPTVAPGKSSDIQVRFDTTNFAGTITKMIYVASNDPQTPMTTLYLTGQILEEIIPTPRQITLGGLRPAERREFTLLIENRSKSTLSLTGFRASPQATVVLDSAPIAPGNRGSLRITITAPAKHNDTNLSGFVAIQTNYPAKPEVIIPFYGALLP